MKNIKKEILKFINRHKDKKPYAIGLALLLLVYACSKTSEKIIHVYHAEQHREFKDGKIFSQDSNDLPSNHDANFNKTIKEVQNTLNGIGNRLTKLEEKASEKPTESQGQLPAPTPTSSPVPSAMQNPVSREPQESHDGQFSQFKSTGRSTLVDRGTSVISFPVKETENSSDIVIPAGSYVKAKVMSGVQAPEGKTFPSLLQLDFAYILPNQNRLDLSGCFMIAKSQGDMSTERVQMQASKLSCVSKGGKMFERDVNGFIADDRDNNFAVEGTVNSKQDRVAAMAFLASIVEGVSKAVQQAQTTQQTTPLGGSQLAVTGDQGTYLAAGGASAAASQVTQWYLKHAEALLPTVNINSGLDIWIVMQDTVKLPKEYFRKTEKSGGKDAYSYLSTLIE